MREERRFAPGERPPLRHLPGFFSSSLRLPPFLSLPQWLKLTSDDVKEQIYKLAKKGLTPSQIGERSCLMWLLR